jgi:hypothetical protein
MRRVVSAAAVFALVIGLIFSLAPHESQAATNLGYADVPFGDSIGDDPTAAKPQSKLWHNDGFWWAVLFSTADNKYHIYRMSPSTPSDWVDTGVRVDDRPLARADALSDGSRRYILSTLSDENTSTAGPGRLYRYTYAAAADTYTLDSGFPVVVTGAVNPVVETMTVDKDTTGRLWVTFTKGTTVYVNYGDNDGASWGEPFKLPGSGSVGSDDISSLVAYTDNDGSSIGVLWSSHTSSSADSYMYFAHHKDSDSSDPRTANWSVQQIYGGTGSCLADDHINLKSLQADPSSGALFAAIKTSIGDSGCPSSGDGLRLVVRNPDNSWKVAKFSSNSENYTRPILVLDSQNREVYMFATAPTSCGAIYYKKTSMANPSFPAKADPFIINSTYTCLNNATSTKQPVNNSTGLVVMASNETSGKRYYVHNFLALGGASNPTSTATSTPTATATTPTATNTPTATSIPGSTTPTATSVPPSGDASIKTITFEGGSLTDPATGVDTVVNSVTLETSAPLKGSYAARVNSTNGYLREDFSGVDELFASFYITLSAKPGSTARLALISNGGTSVGTLNLTTGGALQLRNGSTNIGSVSPALALGAVYRVGLHQKKGSGNAVLEAYLAQGDVPFGAPFASSATQSFTTQATRFSLGATNSKAVNVTVDEIRLDTTGFASGSTPSGTATPTSTPTATNTPTITPTADPNTSPTATNMPTNTPVATATATPPSGGSRIKDITFESGLTGADGADSASGTTITRITTGALKGGASAQVANTSAASAYLQEDFTAVDNLFVSFYLKVNTLPTSDLRIALISNSGTTVGELLLRSNGSLRLRNAGTTIGSDSAALAAGTIYRIGLVQKKGTGGDALLQAFLATGDAAFGAPFAQTTSGGWTSQATRLRVGATVSGVVNLIVDDVRLDGAAMP